MFSDEEGKTMENKMVSVLCKNISHVYKNQYVEEKVLENVNLRLEKGKLYSLLGPSGSGKTTLLNIMGGLLKPTSGDVYIDGENIVNFSEKKLSELIVGKIGYIFQNYNLIPFLTVKENILLQHKFMKHESDRNTEYYEYIIKKLGIKECEDKYVEQLSGGQQQRVAIARCFIMKPSVILADEPTGNLDSENTKKFIELVKEIIGDNQLSFVIVTHDERISQYCDKTIRLDNHRIEFV